MTKDYIKNLNDFSSDLQYLLGKLKKYPLITHQRELELANIIQNKESGWEKAREELFLSNMRLVVSIAKRFSNQESFVDLIQEGMFGLFSACEKFKAKKNCRFSTYATFWIKQSIIRYLHNSVRLIRLPVNVSEQVRHTKNFITSYNKLNGRDPTIKELSNHFNLSEKKIEYVLRSMLLEPKSLNDLVKTKDNTETNGEEYISEPNHETVNEMELKLLKLEVNNVLTILNQTEKYIICSRFCINNTPYKTLDELASELGCCRERVRQIEINACKKLKNSNKVKPLIEYIK